MGRKAVKYRNHMMFRPFMDFYDAIAAFNGVIVVMPGGMSSVGSSETIFEILHSTVLKQWLKVECGM